MVLNFAQVKPSWSLISGYLPLFCLVQEVSRLGLLTLAGGAKELLSSFFHKINVLLHPRLPGIM